MARRKQNIIGASAGAMLLSSGNKYTKNFGKNIGINEEMPKNFDSDGLNFTDHILFPHYERGRAKAHQLHKPAGR